MKKRPGPIDQIVFLTSKKFFNTVIKTFYKKIEHMDVVIIIHWPFVSLFFNASTFAVNR